MLYFHHLHLWNIDYDTVVMGLHIVVRDTSNTEQIKTAIKDEAKMSGIAHAII